MKFIYWVLLILNLVLLVTFITSACGMEEPQCPTPVCQNQGIPNGCECQCPPGTSGSECQDKNPCYGTNCQNGGLCNPNTGKCDCPPEYTGVNCQTPRTPKSFTINTVTITKWPLQLPNGNPWDNGSRPDIFFSLINGASPGDDLDDWPFKLRDPWDEAVLGQYCTWTLTKTISHLDTYWTLGYWDDDGNSSDPDLMATIKFKPISKVMGFPNSIAFETSEAKVIFTGKWNF